VRKLIGLVVMTAGMLAIGVAAWLSIGGISAKQAPGAIETAAARRLRSLAIPKAARQLANPVASNAEAVRHGMEHFADHCAVCHANDGSGDTEMGRGLYPRPPDMRLEATQQLTDGELFFIIENGVRFTGMPAWGTGSHESQESTWRLVHFIRHLPKLTAAERRAMERLNPKPPAEAPDGIDPDRFLSGEDPPATARPKRPQKGK
jgi:mono/diheme cytochrome c family protein